MDPIVQEWILDRDHSEFVIVGVHGNSESGSVCFLL